MDLLTGFALWVGTVIVPTIHRGCCCLTTEGEEAAKTVLVVVLVAFFTPLYAWCLWPLVRNAGRHLLNRARKGERS